MLLELMRTMFSFETKEDRAAGRFDKRLASAPLEFDLFGVKLFRFDRFDDAVIKKPPAPH